MTWGINIWDPLSLIWYILHFLICFLYNFLGMSKYIIFWGVTGMLDPDSAKSFMKESTLRS